MSLYEYEPLVLFLEPKTSNEEKDRRDIDGVGPSCTKVVEQPRDLRRRKNSLEREATEQTLKQVEFVLQKVSFQKYASITTKVGE